MKKKTYITPSLDCLSLDLMALMAGSVQNVDSNADIDPVVSGGNEPARSKEASFWDNDWQE